MAKWILAVGGSLPLNIPAHAFQSAGECLLRDARLGSAFSAADPLSAIGALGIARTVGFCSSLG